MSEPIKPRALDCTEMMNGGRQQRDEDLGRDVDQLNRSWRFRALTPLSWIEPGLGGGKAVRVLYEVLCCPHSSDYAADPLMVANPVVLKAVWSGSELGRSHAFCPC